MRSSECTAMAIAALCVVIAWLWSSRNNPAIVTSSKSRKKSRSASQSTPARLRHLMPWEELELRGDAEKLDEAGHMFLVPGFASEEEMAHLRSLATGTRHQDAMPQTLNPQTAATGHAIMVNVNLQFRLRDDEVAANLSRRLGELTGIPPHDEEDFATLTLMRPWCKPHDMCPTFRHELEQRSPTSAHLTAGSSSEHGLSNLHHDHNQNPRRVVRASSFEARRLSHNPHECWLLRSFRSLLHR